MSKDQPQPRRPLPYIDPCTVCGGSHLSWLHDFRKRKEQAPRRSGDWHR